MSGTSSNIRFDQFDSMDPPGKPLPPEENQDESTEYPNSLDTWDTYGDFTGTDKQGKENNKWHPFKSKSLKEKGEMENTPSDQRQKLHKGEGTKGKKKESQNGLKPNSSEKQELSGSAMESPHTSLTEVVKSVAVSTRVFRTYLGVADTALPAPIPHTESFADSTPALCTLWKSSSSSARL